MLKPDNNFSRQCIAKRVFRCCVFYQTAIARLDCASPTLFAALYATSKKQEDAVILSLYTRNVWTR